MDGTLQIASTKIQHLQIELHEKYIPHLAYSFIPKGQNHINGQILVGFTVAIDEILSVKNVQAWVSMVSYLKK